MCPALSIKKQSAASLGVDENFISVPLETLKLNTVVSFDVYLKIDNRYVFYRKKQLPFDEKHKENLLANHNFNIYVHFDQKDAYLEYVERHIDSIIANENLSLKERAKLVYSSASKIVKDIIEKPDSGNILKRSENFIQHKVNFILKDEKSFHSVVQLMSHDYYTYTHSINVCTFSIAMASRRLGINDISTLQQIGIGAMLHDLGKSRIDKSVLVRPGPLSPDEWDLMKQHPLWGLEIAKSHGDIPDISREIIVGHHEKCDGSGYPAGLSNGQIPLHARIACIVDIYDALSTKRPYKKKLKPFEALALMKNEMKNGLDKDLFIEFIFLLKE